MVKQTNFPEVRGLPEYTLPSHREMFSAMFSSLLNAFMSAFPVFRFPKAYKEVLEIFSEKSFSILRMFSGFLKTLSTYLLTCGEFKHLLRCCSKMFVHFFFFFGV